MKRKIIISSLLVCLLALGLIFVSCDDGTTGDGHTEFENTFYIGCLSDGTDYYIGNTNMSPSQNTPDSVSSIPGYGIALGEAWDNTPDWKTYVEIILSWGIKKNGKSVSYSDLPDYSGSGEQGNRNQHYVFVLP